MKIFSFPFLWLLLTVSMSTVVFNSYGQSEQGVTINGVKWATRNVANSGVFAASPEDAGMFYQWNRNVAWASTGCVTNWDCSVPDGGIIWRKAENPCPEGWRVPSQDDMQKLFCSCKVSNEWTTEKDVNGCKFIDKATGNSIFLPAAGFRLSDGALNYAGSIGYYWSNLHGGWDGAYSMSIRNDYYGYCKDGCNAGGYYNLRTLGLTIRCVAE